MIPSPELIFHSFKTTPHISAPSSPDRVGRLFCHHASAPTSPTTGRSLYSSFHTNPAAAGHGGQDFVFGFQFDSGNPPPELTTADKLFEQGMIRPLNPLPPLCFPSVEKAPVVATANRGRNRASSSPSASHRKGSIFRNFQIPASLTPHSPRISRKESGDGGRGWRIKDFILLCSGWESHSTGKGSKNPSLKLTTSPKLRGGRGGEESRSSSIRSVDSGGSMRRGTPYTTSRAAVEEMKKTTALPYRMGFFAFLSFLPTVYSVRTGGGGCRFTKRR